MTKRESKTINKTMQDCRRRKDQKDDKTQLKSKVVIDSKLRWTGADVSRTFSG